jgi:hypothetical protein
VNERMKVSLSNPLGTFLGSLVLNNVNTMTYYSMEMWR